MLSLLGQGNTYTDGLTFETGPFFSCDCSNFVILY